MRIAINFVKQGGCIRTGGCVANMLKCRPENCAAHDLAFMQHDLRNVTKENVQHTQRSAALPLVGCSGEGAEAEYYLQMSHAFTHACACACAKTLQNCTHQAIT